MLAGFNPLRGPGLSFWHRSHIGSIAAMASTADTASLQVSIVTNCDVLQTSSPLLTQQLNYD